MQTDVAEGLELQERELLALLAGRLRAGFVDYGALNVDRSKKDFLHEALEELLDTIAYIAMELMRRQHIQDPGVPLDAPTGNSGLVSGNAENPGTSAAPAGAPGTSRDLLEEMRQAVDCWSREREEMQKRLDRAYEMHVRVELERNDARRDAEQWRKRWAEETERERNENIELRKALRDLKAAIEAVYSDDGMGPGYVKHVSFSGTERSTIRKSLRVAEELLAR